MTTIPHVADAQLIETAWGNAVADQVNANAVALAAIPAGASLPRGVLAYRIGTAAFAGIAAAAIAITPLSLPALTLDPARLYRVSTYLRLILTAAARVNIQIKDGASTVQQQDYSGTTNAADGSYVAYIVKPTAGVHTFTIAASVTSGTAQAIGDPTSVMYSMVEDLGLAP